MKHLPRERGGDQKSDDRISSNDLFRTKAHVLTNITVSRLHPTVDRATSRCWQTAQLSDLAGLW
jgi:hypothetical protein